MFISSTHISWIELMCSTNEIINKSSPLRRVRVGENLPEGGQFYVDWFFVYRSIYSKRAYKMVFIFFLWKGLVFLIGFTEEIAFKYFLIRNIIKVFLVFQWTVISRPAKTIQHHPTCWIKNVGCVCGLCWMMLDQQFFLKKKICMEV